MTIRHDEEAQRFVVETGHGHAVVEYQRDGDAVDFTHTFVPPEERGQGIAEALVGRALDWAAAEHLTVQASCWYVARVHQLRQGRAQRRNPATE